MPVCRSIVVLATTAEPVKPAGLRGERTQHTKVSTHAV